MADPIFTIDNWLPTEPKPEDFISSPIVVWNQPTKQEYSRQYAREYYKKNREKMIKNAIEYRTKNPEKVKKRKREHYTKNREKLLKQQAKYRSENPGKRREYWVKNREKLTALHRAWYQRNIEKMREADGKRYIKYRDIRNAAKRKQARIIKLLVISHYSNNENKCACCGVSRFDLLTIDHIVPIGNKQRRELNLVGSQFYPWLVKNKFPSGYQVLCFGCNASKHIGDHCTIDHSKDLVSQEERRLTTTAPPTSLLQLAHHHHRREMTQECVD